MPCTSKGQILDSLKSNRNEIGSQGSSPLPSIPPCSALPIPRVHVAGDRRGLGTRQRATSAPLWRWPSTRRRNRRSVRNRWRSRAVIILNVDKLTTTRPEFWYDPSSHISVSHKQAKITFFLGTRKTLFQTFAVEYSTSFTFARVICSSSRLSHSKQTHDNLVGKSSPNFIHSRW